MRRFTRRKTPVIHRHHFARVLIDDVAGGVVAAVVALSPVCAKHVFLTGSSPLPDFYDRIWRVVIEVCALLLVELQKVAEGVEDATLLIVVNDEYPVRSLWPRQPNGVVVEVGVAIR